MDLKMSTHLLKFSLTEKLLKTPTLFEPNYLSFPQSKLKFFSASHLYQFNNLIVQEEPLLHNVGLLAEAGNHPKCDGISMSGTTMSLLCHHNKMDGALSHCHIVTFNKHMFMQKSRILKVSGWFNQMCAGFRVA